MILNLNRRKIPLESPQNVPHEIVKEDAVEEILSIYESSKKTIPPIYASDGSIIRREGYDDILFSEDLYHYFEENVYGKGDYKNPVGYPVLNYYDSWLDETYGKSNLKKFWEHMSTLDGFQEMLDVAGIFFEGADLLNCFIYVCRGKGKEAALSFICAAPLIGDQIGKGGKLAMGATADLGVKLGKDGKKIVEGLELVYKTSSDGAAFLRKHIDEALDLLSSGMHGEDGYRLAFAGGGYFDNAGKITFSIVDDAGNASSYVRYIDDVVDGANRSARDGSSKVVIEGAGEAVSSISQDTINHSTIGDFTYNPKTGAVSKVKGGGHGQANIDFLEENGIPYNIEKTYDNGVRIGNIPDHKNPLKRIGTGQSWFPETWDTTKINNAGEYVVELNKGEAITNGVPIYGIYDGVEVGVIYTNGKPATIFPNAIQP
ncbi:EndoU domain-containing protein [Clostridium boliviensis]|uniref:EndoU domain-containing protein n=1 Tax=Clostridium boliviensis TaxID=318465 RepID=A0ABU4GHW3_9CLOT|nr:EndoU domain-containing protein [Clostridium boliviensis]MDW2797194.1 EndoU domain-containing protein [Clostridium boliviensis]